MAVVAAKNKKPVFSAGFPSGTATKIPAKPGKANLIVSPARTWCLNLTEHLREYMLATQIGNTTV